MSSSFAKKNSCPETPRSMWDIHRALFALFIFFLSPSPANAAVNIPLTVNLSETVNVTGTPRIAVDVGGTTRYATYTSGTGSNSLTFTLAPQAGDVDLDGVTVSSPIDLNGGTIKDVKGNNAALTFTPPSTTNVKVNYPSLGMDFVYDADGRYTLNGTVYNDLTSFLSAAGGTFTRASIGTYFDSTGTLQTAASGVPRFDYDPVTHAAKGILIEEQRTNFTKYSDQFDNSYYTKSLLTVSPNVTISPNGASDADLIDEGTGSGPHQINTSTQSVTLGVTYTASIYAKANTGHLIQLSFVNSSGYFSGLGYANYDLSSGSITQTSGSLVDSGISSIGNGWYRCWISATATLTGSGSGLIVYTSDSATTARAASHVGTSQTIYLWGHQFEQGSFPSSYIPTTSATVTRTADNLSLPTSIFINNSSGTLFSEASFQDYTSTTSMNAVSSLYASSNTRTVIGRRIGGGTNASQLAFYAQDSGVDQAWLRSIGAVTSTAPVKSAATYNSNDFAYKTPATSLVTDTSGTIPSFPTLYVGSINGIGSYLNGNILKFKYYPARVTNTQLQLLTQ